MKSVSFSSATRMWIGPSQWQSKLRSDAALSIIRSGQADLEATLAALEHREPRWRIFQRIALYLLSEVDSQTAARLAAERLTNRDVFEAPECLHEYVGLLHRRFQSLDNDQQRKILDWIDGGPLPEQLENMKRNLPQFTGRPVSDEEIEHFKKTWRRDWLQRLGDNLPAEKKPELETLVAELGLREHPDWGSYRSEAVGSQSPLGLDDFKRRSITAQVEYLHKWRPSSDEFMGPSRAGLGEQLAKLVTENPDAYAKEAHSFVDVDPTYQRLLLNGLREAVEKGSAFDWRPVFQLCRRILEEPIEITGRRSTPLDDDPDRTWCRNAVATLLETALRQKQVPIPIGLKDELWKILEALSHDPNPTPEHEARYGGSNMDPATLSLNSMRGQAMHAVIQYAWWVCQSASKNENETSNRGATSSFDGICTRRRAPYEKDPPFQSGGTPPASARTSGELPCCTLASAAGRARRSVGPSSAQVTK